MTTHAVTTPTTAPLGDDELARIDAWWRAANYLSVGQIYLMDNPLLREPLKPEHVKPRLLGPGGFVVPRGQLHRDLPRHHPRRGRYAAAVQAVLLPRRHPQPRGPG